MTSPPRFMMVHRHQPMSDTDPVRFVIRRYRGGEVRRRPWQGSGNGDRPPDGEWASLGPFWEYAYRTTEEDTAEEDTAGGPPLDWAPDDEGWELVDLATIPRPVIAGTGLVAHLYTDATRADMENATPDELLRLLGLLWDQLCCRPGDDLVVPGFIDHLAALTVRGGQSLPGWLAPSEATDRLRRPLMGELHEIGVSLGLHSAALSERGWGAEDGALWLTSHWGREVRRRWGEGYAPDDDESRQKWAAHLAGDLSAAEVMRAWLDPEHEGPIPSPLVAWIARQVWGEVLPQLDIERAALERLRRPVALAVGVLDRVMAPGRATGGLQTGTDGKEWLTRARPNAPAELLAVWQPPTVTVQDAERLLALARAGAGKLGTVTGARLLYWLPGAFQRRAADPGEPLVILAGEHGNAYAELAALIGAPTDRDGARDVRAVLMAMGATWLRLEAGGRQREGHLLTVDYMEGRGRGHVSRLTLTPGWPFKLNPAELRGEAAELSALAPLPPLLGNLPPMPGTVRRNEQAATARLYPAVLGELANQNREIWKGNGAHLPGSRLAGLAVEVGVIRPGPLELGSGVLALWTRDGEHGPALLECVGEDRYHLGPAFPEERRVLEEGGQRREGQAERGERSARNRKAKADSAAARRKRRGD